MKQSRPLRSLACLLFVVASLLGARDSLADFCSPSHSFGPAPTNYEVGNNSRIVVLQYAIWFDHIAVKPNNGMVPSLAMSGTNYYLSSDCNVLGNHASQFISMGVDAVVLDYSNGIQCAFSTAADDAMNNEYACQRDRPVFEKIRDNGAAVYQYYNSHNVPVRIIPLVGGQGGELFRVNAVDGKTTFRRALEYFENLANAYPGQVVRYQGKPLMTVYVGAPTQRFSPRGPGTGALISNGNTCAGTGMRNLEAEEGLIDYLAEAQREIACSGKQNTFTFRMITGFTDSQPYLWAGIEPNNGLRVLARPTYPVWSWVDRLSADLTTLRPSYSTDAASGKPENLTVTMGFYGTICPLLPDEVACRTYNFWLASDARTRGPADSPVLNDFINKAKLVQPRFLFVHNYNEFSSPDQGTTGATSADIEPTSVVNGGPGWGNAYVDLLRTKITEYKTALTRPINIASRGWVGTGDNIMIGGFVVGGPAPKKVLLKARGPSLAPHGVPNTLPNPTLLLISASGVIAANDDWAASPNYAELVANGWNPPHPNESAILITLNPGSYTAHLSGINGATGVGIFEAFEIDNPGHPFTNMSTRGWVGTGDNVMIGGFIIAGTQPQQVLLTAGGPSMIPYGIPNALANPRLALYSASGLIASNDDWGQAWNAWQISGTGHAPTHPWESAILISLPPGAYTAIVSGAGWANTGIGIISMYPR